MIVYFILIVAFVAYFIYIVVLVLFLTRRRSNGRLFFLVNPLCNHPSVIGRFLSGRNNAITAQPIIMAVNKKVGIVQL